MKKQLSMDFNTRQYMQSGDFELFYYNDTALKSVDAHEHDYYEFYFFLEGDVTYHIGDKSYQLEYGDCLLIPPDTPHYPQVCILAESGLPQKAAPDQRRFDILF